jgi:hypothetical protein
MTTNTTTAATDGLPALPEHFEKLDFGPHSTGEVADMMRTYGLACIAATKPVPAGEAVTVLRKALYEAIRKFQQYETLHRAKGTGDSNAKAEVNAELAGRFKAILAGTAHVADGGAAHAWDRLHGNYDARMKAKESALSSIAATERAATQPAGASICTSDWQLYADAFNVEPETIDYDGDKWAAFIAGVNAGRNDLAAPISEASAPRDERIDVLRRALEIIAVGDAPSPAQAAADALVITGLWQDAKAEQVKCGACHGSGWVVRDPDIGTDQECFACDGSGVDNDPESEAKSEASELPPLPVHPEKYHLWSSLELEAMRAYGQLCRDTASSATVSEDAGGDLVEDICDAYESGFGHGVQKDGHSDGKAYFSNAHSATAYVIGYEAGEGSEAPAAPSGSIGELPPISLDSLQTYPSPHGTLVRRADVECMLARTPAIVGSIGEDAEFRKHLLAYGHAFYVGVTQDMMNSAKQTLFIYLDTIIQGASKAASPAPTGARK